MRPQLRVLGRMDVMHLKWINSRHLKWKNGTQHSTAKNTSHVIQVCCCYSFSLKCCCCITFTLYKARMSNWLTQLTLIQELIILVAWKYILLQLSNIHELIKKKWCCNEQQLPLDWQSQRSSAAAAAYLAAPVDFWRPLEFVAAEMLIKFWVTRNKSIALNVDCDEHVTPREDTLPGVTWVLSAAGAGLGAAEDWGSAAEVSVAAAVGPLLVGSSWTMTLEPESSKNKNNNRRAS